MLSCQRGEGSLKPKFVARTSESASRASLRDPRSGQTRRVDALSSLPSRSPSRHARYVAKPARRFDHLQKPVLIKRLKKRNEAAPQCGAFKAAAAPRSGRGRVGAAPRIGCAVVGAADPRVVEASTRAADASRRSTRRGRRRSVESVEASPRRHLHARRVDKALSTRLAYSAFAVAILYSTAVEISISARRGPFRLVLAALDCGRRGSTKPTQARIRVVCS